MHHPAQARTENASTMNALIRYQIRALAAQRGMSERALAIAAGMSQPTLSRFLSGKTEDLTASNLKNIADALGCLTSHITGEIALHADGRTNDLVVVMEKLPDWAREMTLQNAKSLLKSLPPPPEQPPASTPTPPAVNNP